MAALKPISEWKQAWKFYSTWAFALLGVMPDLYNATTSAGLLEAGAAPAPLVWCIRTAALLGLLLRMVKQVKPPEGTS